MNQSADNPSRLSPPQHEQDLASQFQETQFGDTQFKRSLSKVMSADDLLDSAPSSSKYQQKRPTQLDDTDRMKKLKSKSELTSLETPRSLLKPVCNRDPTKIPQKSPISKPAKKHICTICGAQFATMSPLVAHFLTHRNLKLNQKQPTAAAPMVYSCNVCNYQCSAASRLRQHQETHIDQPQVHCPTCKKAFRTQRLLDQHITRQHVKIECKECGQTFLKRNDMVEHYLKHFDLTLKKQP